MKRLALLLVLAGFGLGACERHELDGPDGTGQLHKHHGAHDLQEADTDHEGHAH